MTTERDNSRPLNLQLWSDRPEVNAAVDAIFAECATGGGIKRQHTRMKTCLKVVLLNLFNCHAADPSCYVRYSRRNVTLLNAYNIFELSNEQIGKAVDNLVALGYVENVKGKWSPDKEKRRQSRMTATDTLIARMRTCEVSPIMTALHPDASAVILKDFEKVLLEYDHTDDTRRMQLEMTTINKILSESFINLYMSDKELNALNERMRTGRVPEHEWHLADDIEDEDETPRGSIDFTTKALRRIFNNGSFKQGGRLYGGWWQSIPRDYRRYIRINRMNTVEVDFSAFHINLIYWLEGVPIPVGDLYTLEGFPPETRNVVKQCLLTMINAKDRKEAMASIRQKIRGYKNKRKKIDGVWIVEKKELPDKDKIVLPLGISKIEKIITTFEQKHRAIKDWLFSGKGTVLQFWDSQIAVEILLLLAKQGIAALPLHDSFMVEEPHKLALQRIMTKAYYKITGRYPNMDAKSSLTDENTERGIETMEAEYQAKMADGTYSQGFRRKYSKYVNNYEEWKKITGKDNVKVYSRISAIDPRDML